MDSALKMTVVCSYRILIPACQSILSGCNTTGSIQTQYIVITPHCHTLISHKPLRPIHQAFFLSRLSTRTASPHFSDPNTSLFLYKITYMFVVFIRSARPQHRTILDVSPVVTVTNAINSL